MFDPPNPPIMDLKQLSGVPGSDFFCQLQGVIPPFFILMIKENVCSSFVDPQIESLLAEF